MNLMMSRPLPVTIIIAHGIFGGGWKSIGQVSWIQASGHTIKWRSLFPTPAMTPPHAANQPALLNYPWANPQRAKVVDHNYPSDQSGRQMGLESRVCCHQVQLLHRHKQAGLIRSQFGLTNECLIVAENSFINTEDRLSMPPNEQPSHDVGRSPSSVRSSPPWSPYFSA